MEAAEAAVAAEVLVRARERLLAGKWVGHLPFKSEENCAETAVWESARNVNGFTDCSTVSSFDYGAISFLDGAAAKLFPGRIQSDRFGYAARVNDHPDTTFNDVMAVYDEAILLAKEAELAAPVSEREPTT